MYSCSKNENRRKRTHLEIIKQMCEGKSNCLVIAENVLFLSTLTCPKSGGQVWMSYSCGNNDLKKSTACHPSKNDSEVKPNVRKNGISIQEERDFQKLYLCDNIRVNFIFDSENINVGSDASVDVDSKIDLVGGHNDCPNKCEKDSRQIYDGKIIKEIRYFGPSFQIEFKTFIRKFDGLLFNILDESNVVILSVTAEKKKLTVAFLVDFKIKYYYIKDLQRNNWYHLTLAQKQSGESMYEVIESIPFSFC